MPAFQNLNSKTLNPRKNFFRLGHKDSHNSILSVQDAKFFERLKYHATRLTDLDLSLIFS